MLVRPHDPSPRPTDAEIGELEDTIRLLRLHLADRRAVDDRHTRQREALIGLTNNLNRNGRNLAATLRNITAVDAEALGVARVSVWRYNTRRDGIHCLSLFDAATGAHSAGMELSSVSYPAYFRALEESEVISADDAATDPRTSEFADGYLGPLGITAMLDAPLHVGGRLDGVLCHEHVGGPRRWTSDEKTFAVAAANLVSLALEGWERQQAEDALRQSDERFRLLGKSSSDAIWDWDMRTDALWWNEGLARLFGEGYDQAVSTMAGWAEQIHADDRDSVAASLSSALARGDDGWSGEYRFARRDGTYAYVFDRGYVLRDAAGQPQRMIGALTDLTDRKRAEDLLREQATLLDHARDAIVVSDLDHRTLYWNRSAERLYGWSAEEVVGRAVHTSLFSDPGVFRMALDLALSSGAWAGEVEQVARDGTVLTVESHWTLVRDDGGAPRSILTINTDVTQRKRLEQQQLRAQRLESIGTLAGGIAHDLNNVLAPILLSIDLLREGETDPDRQDTLTTIAASAERGAAMVSQVLSFARGLEGRRSEVDVRLLVQDLVRIMRETFPRNITIDQQVGDDIRPIQADPTQLHQVLLNLCVNARDAMTDGGRLTVRAANTEMNDHDVSMNIEARVGPHVSFDVEDTGTGMSRDVMEKIFDPFFTTKDTGKGTGLGLSTSLAIVKGHGGFIRVYSEAGKGSRFRLYLPAGTMPVAPVAGAGTRSLPRGDGQTVLVVDDEASIRTVARRTLEAFGYKALLAADGAEAVRLFTAHQQDISVVLTDMMMPVMDGRATIQVLRQLNPEVRLIGASGLTTNDQKAQSAGVSHFLAKPFTTESLLSVLRTALTEKD